MQDITRGMHWIGHPGSLWPIADFGEESVEHELDVKVRTSMGGGRRIRVSRVRPLRSWSLTVPNAHADDVSPVVTLMNATMPPYVLVTAGAQVSNVLTPDRSEMLSVSSGSVSLAGGWPIADSGGAWSTTVALNTAAANGAQGLVRVGPAPVPPVRSGRKVTVSAHLATARAEGCWVVLDWLGADGAQVGAGVTGNAVTGMDALRRSTATAQVPFGAVTCRIGILYAERISQPQVTWTDAPIPEWSTGRGADRVVITSLPSSTSLAVPEDYNLRRGDYTIGLMEAGPA